ncbi:MAG: hypothetical protein WC897_01280 [Candidatus Gracilibacteria bacterium]
MKLNEQGWLENGDGSYYSKPGKSISQEAFDKRIADEEATRRAGVDRRITEYAEGVARKLGKTVYELTAFDLEYPGY